MMNSYAMKIICFHLGYSDIQNLILSDLEESVINPSLEPMLNNLSDSQQLEIVGDIDIHQPEQKVFFYDVPIATKNSILGRCIKEYKQLFLDYGFPGNGANRRITLLRSPANWTRRYTTYLQQLSQCIGLNGSYKF
jgi:hypothetical protein